MKHRSASISHDISGDGMFVRWNLVSVDYCRTQWTAQGSVFAAVCDFFACLCMKYVGNRWTNLRHIHTEDVFGPSLGQVWMPRSKVKGQGHEGQKLAVYSQHLQRCGLNGTPSLQITYSASIRRNDSVTAEGCLRRYPCAGPGGLPSSWHWNM